MYMCTLNSIKNLATLESFETDLWKVRIKAVKTGSDKLWVNQQLHLVEVSAVLLYCALPPNGQRCNCTPSSDVPGPVRLLDRARAGPITGRGLGPYCTPEPGRSMSISPTRTSKPVEFFKYM